MVQSNEPTQALSERCLGVATLADEAALWISDPDNREKVGAEMERLRRDFRRSGIRARKLAKAAKRNMCVGVYGPSQAGKSYLISVLGRPKGGELKAAFDGLDEPLGYLDKINPEGQGESTGLVTRFTTAAAPAEPGFPIKVRLLSEAGLVGVLANAFAMDGDSSETPPEAEELERLLANAEMRVHDASDPPLNAEDIWDLQEYVSTVKFPRSYLEALEGYWERAASAAPRLGLAERAELLSVLWGRHRPLTDLFLSLAARLEELGHAQEAFVPMDALAPREQSIIDVQMLKGLDGKADAPAVAVRAKSGASATLPRAELTALVSEIIVPMAEKPWEFMDETDLLDFPGTRNRFTVDLKSYLEKGEAPRAQLFLRGKVAYLFDRYVAEQELTSMLLCIDEGNMEARDLPGLVDRWVGATHGAASQGRRKAKCLLFFVLTKFDTLLLESGGSGDDPRTRFERRIQNSMVEPFGRHPDSWLNEWSDDTPFKNTFWLRNPKYEAAVIEYDEGRRETGLRPDRRDRIAELRDGATESSLVQRHFDDPEDAWDAAMTMNDGGVSRLAASLAEVCVPRTKLVQVEFQLNGLARDLRVRLDSFYESSDIDARLEERREAADHLIDELETCFKQNRWGGLMEELMADPADIVAAIQRVPADVRIVSESESTDGEGAAHSGNSAARPRPGRPRPGRRRSAAPDSRAPANAAAQLRRMTTEAFQAERALALWRDRIGALANHPGRLDRYKLTKETASDLVEQLIVASRRLGLEARIRSALRQWNFSLRAERRALPASTVAAAEINSFIACLGMDQLDEADRPVVDLGEDSRHVFMERPVQYVFADLPEAPETGLDDRYDDWVHALYRMFEDNARNVDCKLVDEKQNLRLGEILAGLNESGRMSGGGVS